MAVRAIVPAPPAVVRTVRRVRGDREHVRRLRGRSRCYTRLAPATPTSASRSSQRRRAEASPRCEAWEQIPEEWWFLGDDVRDQKKQELIAKYFGLYRVLFRGNDQWATLGVTDVKLTMHYDFDAPVCLDELDR